MFKFSHWASNASTVMVLFAMNVRFFQSSGDFLFNCTAHNSTVLSVRLDQIVAKPTFLGLQGSDGALFELAVCRRLRVYSMFKSILRQSSAYSFANGILAVEPRDLTRGLLLHIRGLVVRKLNQ